MLINELLMEDLGNLAQLGLGSMSNMLRQHQASGSVSKASGHDLRDQPAGNKWHRRYQDIGRDSQIVDVGVLKKGMASLRQAYRLDHEDAIKPMAFALYIDGQAAAFGRYEEDDLRTANNLGMFAYDITPWTAKIEAELKAKQDAETSQWSRDRHTMPKMQTQKTKELGDWDKEKFEKKNPGQPIPIQKFYGENTPMYKVSTFIDTAMKLGTVTCKIVMSEKMDKVRNRQNNPSPDKKPSHYYNEKEELRKDLQRRLQVFKNARKPTVDNIEMFMDAVTRKATGQLRFGGQTYSLTPSSKDTVSALDLLNGKVSFKVNYKNLEPDRHDEMVISYLFWQPTNAIIPITAEWSTRDDKYTGKTQLAILHPQGYLAANKIPFNDKDKAIPAILTLIKAGGDADLTKAQRFVQALTQAGVDWPEIAVIQKSINAVRAEKAAKKAA